MDSEQQKHTKKVIIKDELSTPEARGTRLRRVRNLANLSRKEICNMEGLNVNTYKGWEIARYGGLPLDGAQKVIKKVAEAGVICSVDWLLYGNGADPYIIPISTARKKDDKEPQNNEYIQHEIGLFQSHFANTIYTKISDDALSPELLADDYVAGIRYFGSEIDNCVDKNCILQTLDGKILVRNLKKGKKKNTYMLICTNIQASIDMPVLYDIELESAAPILRIYRSDVL